MNKHVIYLVTTALMAALICILGPLSIPIGPVPISLTNLAIYITMYVLDTKRGSLAFIIYLLIGLCGLPVFSGFSGGPAKLFGPTGGYIIGFIPMAIVCGLVFKHFYKNKIICIIGMEAATWIAYLCGTGWLAYSTHMSFTKALSVGVIPFIIVDLIKIVISAFIGPILKERIRPIFAYQEEARI